jgi:hypothetical protein
MSGQFLVEPDPELELEPDDEPEALDPAAPDPAAPDPELPVFELDDGVVVDELELLPEFPVVVDVVAALATSAPPARSPDVSAPTARTLRKRICMASCPFICVKRRPVRGGTAHVALRICGPAHNDVGGCAESCDRHMTNHSKSQRGRTDRMQVRGSRSVAGAQRAGRMPCWRAQALVARQQ